MTSNINKVSVPSFLILDTSTGSENNLIMHLSLENKTAMKRTKN